MRFLAKITNIIKFFPIFLALSTVNTANAGENNPSVKFGFLSTNGLIISDTIIVDADFSKKHNIPAIMTPFQIKVPRQNGLERLIEYGTEPNSMIIKLNFVTNSGKENENRQLVENLQFIPMSVDMTDPEDRIKALTNLMVNDAFNMVTQNYEKKEYIGARRAKINNIDVIDAVGSFIEPNLGLIYVRITGYLNPNKTDGIFSVANIVADKYDITNLEQLFLTGSGKTIESFEYLRE